MGWFKKLTGISSTDFMDKLYPESYKKTAAKWGDNTIKMPLDSGSSAVAPEAPAMSLGETEAQELASKRLARMGKYFTSPTGILGNANTASAKTFS
jgi:hypothetical protein